MKTRSILLAICAVATVSQAFAARDFSIVKALEDAPWMQAPRTFLSDAQLAEAYGYASQEPATATTQQQAAQATSGSPFSLPVLSVVAGLAAGAYFVFKRN
jgi:hypothetical protein